MGSLVSKPREQSIRRTGTQPGQHGPQNPEPTPTSLNPHISTARPNLGNEIQIHQSQRVPTPPAASRSTALGSNPPAVAVHGKGTRISKCEHPPQTRTPSPPVGLPPDTLTNDHELTPGARGDRADGQQFKSSEHGAIGVDGDVPQTEYIHPGAQEFKTTKDHGGRSPLAMGILPPHNSRPGKKSRDSPAVEEIERVPSAIPGNTDSSETPEHLSTAVFPTSQTPHPVADNNQTPNPPVKARLPPIPYHRQRSVFKRLDCVLRVRFHLKAGVHSSLTSSVNASASLPDLTVQPTALGPTELDKESPYSPLESRTQPLRRRFSLSELRGGLLSANGKRSAKLDALDCTKRLSKRTGPTGSGGFSDVSQAWLGNRLVAVKALRAINIDGIDEIRMRKRLGREIYVWASLHHPYVLEFLGFAFENGRPCLISPWCEHGTLEEYLQKYHGADHRVLVRQIAEGLKYLHVQEPPVIHGDFKTANVLITDKHIPKICDFGGSKRLGEGGTGFTTAGLGLTTIRYSAPEILLEGQHHTLPSDVYSFACVALETMTNKYPFWKLPNSVAVIRRVVFEKQAPSPGDHPELEDDELWELLRRCWSHEPSDRPTMITVCNKLAKEGYGPTAVFYLTESG